MEIIVFAMLLGLIPAFIAKSKGRSFATWWIYGALLWIIALPHSIFMKDLTEKPAVVPQPQPPEREMKKCPYCAEMIKREAIVCRYCGKDLPSPTKACSECKVTIPSDLMECPFCNATQSS